MTPAFLSLAETVTEADGICGTGTNAHTATDAFCVIWRFCHIYIHLAGLCAFPAGNAFVFIHLHSEKRHLVEQCIECTEWAQPLAERTVKQHAQHYYRNQNAKLPRKECAECGTNSRIDGGKRYCSLKHTLRTEVLAEERITHADIVCDKHRQKNHHNKQNHIFYIGQRLQLLCR